MYAIELPVEIDHTHQIHLQLPDTVKVGIHYRTLFTPVFHRIRLN